MSLTTGLIDQLPAYGRLTKHADRQAWLDSRAAKCHGGAGLIGGSTAPALFGIGHLALWDLWAYHSGIDVPPAFDSGVMRRGRRLEVPILEELADVTGWQVEHWPQSWTVSEPDESLRLGATPDGLARVTGFDSERFHNHPFESGDLLSMQVKSANEWAKRAWPRTGGTLAIPVNYEVQTQVELRCLGLQRGVLVVLFGMDMDDLEIIPFERHEAFQTSLTERLKWFWELVENGEEPPIDGSASTARVLARLYPDDLGTLCELPGDADLWAADFIRIREEMKQLKAQRDTAKNRLIGAIGDSTWAETPMGQAFSFKQQSRAGLDRDKLEHDFPEAHAACWVADRSKFRVLRDLKKLPPEAIEAPEAGGDEDDDE